MSLFFAPGLAFASGEIVELGNQTNPAGNTINVTEDSGIGLAGTGITTNYGEIDVWGNWAVGMDSNTSYPSSNNPDGLNAGTIKVIIIIMLSNGFSLFILDYKITK